MVDFALVAVAAVFYFAGLPKWAFWIVILAVIYGLLAIWRSVKRMQAGPYPQNGIKELIATKATYTAVMAFGAWWLGSKAGYF